MTSSANEAMPPVAILLGGKGTRLGLQGVPKPMVPFLGRPLLERTVEQLADQGCRRIVFLTGHLGEVIEQAFGDGSRYGVSIDYCAEEVPLGTARATAAARAALGDEFLLLYGDVVFDIDLARFLRAGRANGGDGTLFVHPNDHPYDSDLIERDDTNRITRFLAKPHAADLLARNLVNAGLYYLRPTIFDAIPQEGDLPDWGRDVFPHAVASGYQLHAYSSAEYIKDIGTPARLAKAERHVTAGIVSARARSRPQRAVFMDRDGVINREINGVHTPAALELVPRAAETIAAINQSAFLSIVATNQPDIAKGFFTAGDLDQVHAALERSLSEAGAYVDDILYCPHHPESGHPGEIAELKRVCDCRKPQDGMLRQAAERHNIDLARSYMIGDRAADMAAGKKCGATTILVHRNAGASLPDDARDCPDADHIALDLAEAWHIIQEDRQQ